MLKVPYGIGVAGNIHIGHLLGSNKAQEAHNAYRVTLTTSRKYLKKKINFIII